MTGRSPLARRPPAPCSLPPLCRPPAAGATRSTCRATQSEAEHLTRGAASESGAPGPVQPVQPVQPVLAEPALACRLFGAAARCPMALVPMLERLRAAGRGRLAEHLLQAVPASLRERLLSGQVSPAEWLATAAGPPRRLAAAGAIAAEAGGGGAGHPARVGSLGSGQAAYAATADVLVIGAGAAGLAAAGALQAQGWSVLVLEAGDRPGGRARTDTQRFATRVDLGAQRLHSGARNPLVPVFRAMGLTLVLDSAPTLASDGTQGENKSDHARALQAVRDRLEAQIAAHPAHDCAMADVGLPQQGPWEATALAQIGALEAGVDLSDLSLAEHRTLLPESAGDYYVAEGLGTAVELLATGLPMRLDTRVSHLSWGAAGVEVVAGGARYAGLRAVVTLSTGQLARGDVQFMPPLPAAKQAALGALPMGTYEKIVLEFSRDVFGAPPPGTRLIAQCTLEDALDFVLMPPWEGRCGAPAEHRVVVAYVGGIFAEALQAEGEAAAIQRALGRLRAAYGSSVDAAFVGGSMTHWAQEHAGAYSAALPGAGAARAVLQQPLGDMLFFAGEACDAPLPSGESWATHVAGAYRSGLQAAAEVGASLNEAARFPAAAADAPAPGGHCL